jgi:hypothetical protein
VGKAGKMKNPDDTSNLSEPTGNAEATELSDADVEGVAGGGDVPLPMYGYMTPAADASGTTTT